MRRKKNREYKKGWVLWRKVSGSNWGWREYKSNKKRDKKRMKSAVYFISYIPTYIYLLLFFTQKHKILLYSVKNNENNKGPFWSCICHKNISKKEVIHKSLWRHCCKYSYYFTVKYQFVFHIKTCWRLSRSHVLSREGKKPLHTNLKHFFLSVNCQCQNGELFQVLCWITDSSIQKFKWFSW